MDMKVSNKTHGKDYTTDASTGGDAPYLSLPEVRIPVISDTDSEGTDQPPKICTFLL
jgi:hypothetical protein